MQEQLTQSTPVGAATKSVQSGRVLNRAERRAAVNKRSQARPAFAHATHNSAIHRVMSRIQPYRGEELVALQSPIWSGFEALRTGSAEPADFNDLCAVVHTCLVRSRSINSVCVEICEQAEAAMFRVKDRFDRMQRLAFDGQGMQDVAPVLDLYKQLLSLSTPLQMQQALVQTGIDADKGLVPCIRAQSTSSRETNP